MTADGGRPEDDEAVGRMRDVSHEPTDGEGANRVWDRGDEDDAE